MTVTSQQTKQGKADSWLPQEVELPSPAQVNNKIKHKALI